MNDCRKVTETLDQLYLEWSQFTDSRTAREMRYRMAVLKALELIDHAHMRNGDFIKAINLLKAARAFDLNLAEEPES